MKKKIVLIIISLLIIGSGLVGCSKEPEDPVVATQSFIDQVMFQESSETFNHAFLNKEKYEALAKDSFELLKLDLSFYLLEGFTEEEQNQFMETLKETAKKNSSYKVTFVEGDKNSAKVKVTVRGLDFSKTIDIMISSLMNDLKINPQNSMWLSEMKDKVFEHLIDALSKTPQSTTEQEFYLDLIVDSRDTSKWTTDVANDKTMGELYYSLYIGEKDTNDLMSVFQKSLEKYTGESLSL